jgi:hypothetical protein
MGNTWIVDLRHYLTPAGATAQVPPRARVLAEYFASIVLDATTNIDDPRLFVAAAVPDISDAAGSPTARLDQPGRN